jgi:large subunit ribosomal protein L29
MKLITAIEVNAIAQHWVRVIPNKAKGGKEMKATELREMSDEQLELTALEAAETMFRMRLQTQTDRVDIPTQTRKNRRLIARVKTIQTERSKSAHSK